MLVTVEEGTIVMILVCTRCRTSVIVRHPERARECGRCGERVEVAADESTQPSGRVAVRRRQSVTRPTSS